MATYYFRNVGVNWGDVANWSLTDGGGATAPNAPLNTDDAIFTNNSGNCSVNTATRNCRSLTFTTYIGTITFDTTLNVVGGNITLGTASMTMVQGAANPAINANMSGIAAVTLSSSGCICAASLQFFKSPGGALAVTMSSNWTQRGNFTVNNTGTTTSFIGNTITFDRTCTITHTTRIGGTTTFLLAPDVGHTITETGGGQFGMPLTINGAGSVIMGSFAYGESLFTYTAGAVTHTGTLTMAAGGTYNTAGMVFQNGSVSTLAASVHTLTSNLTFSGAFAVPGSSSTFNGVGLKIIVGTNLTIGGGILASTASIMMNGTGTLSGAGTFGAQATIEINTGGAITISGAIAWLRTLLFSGGTIISTGSSITCASIANFTLNAAGFNMNNFTCASVNFLGTQGCTIGTYTCVTAGSINTFASTETYNITAGLDLLGTAASNVAFRSSTGGVQANVILTLGSAMTVAYVDADDINSAGGQTIWNYDGTLTNTVNWALLQNPTTVGYPWVR